MKAKEQPTNSIISIFRGMSDYIATTEQEQNNVKNILKGTTEDNVKSLDIKNLRLK